MELKQVNNPQSSYTFKFQDLDGDGGQNPTISVDQIPSNTTFDTQLTFLNETLTPVSDVTDEIRTESDQHQIFYLSETLDISYTDMDSNRLPLGLTTRMISDSISSSGDLTIILRHEPNKEANNVQQGIITNAGGETDIEITFNFDVVK